MSRRSPFVISLLLLCGFSLTSFAGDLRITLPKRSKPTPVQSLNRDGVKAVEKHDYEKAKKLFYKAYLIDPNDPFTLNNLGYMAELDGEIDRAQRYYALASEIGSDAIVDQSSAESLQGKPVSEIAGAAEDKGIQINRYNVQAISLLQRDRAPEADLVLQKALAIDSKNAFTLNNLGYAKEKEGEFDSALQFYTAAANIRSDEKIEVAVDRGWRGRQISDVADKNAKKLREMMDEHDSPETQVARLNLRGVSAMNRNDRRTAKSFFEQAYKVNPDDAFTLNNMGYLAELDGDRETADYYYDRAREADHNRAKVTLATRRDVEGKRIGEVADVSDQLVNDRIEQIRLLRQQQGGPVTLRDRNNALVTEPDKPLQEGHSLAVSDVNGEIRIPIPAGSGPARPIQPSTGLLTPLPESQQPEIKSGANEGGLLQPLPDNQQPGSQQPPSQVDTGVTQGPTDGGIIMPLPDNQQPGTQPTPNQSAAPQSAPGVKEGDRNNGLLMPLPEKDQPAAPKQ